MLKQVKIDCRKTSLLNAMNVDQKSVDCQEENIEEFHQIDGRYIEPLQ